MADQTKTIKSGFFDSINGDRKYTADDMNRPYKRVITEGIFATPLGTPSTDLQVISAQNGMNITVKAGQGLLGGKWFENQADFQITVSNNTAVVPRRDSIIIQIDTRQSGRNVNIIYREGVANSNPLPPDLDVLSGVIEKRVANIYVAAGASYIGNDAITDLRGSSELPWITSLINQVDTSTLLQQFETAYWGFYNNSKEEWQEFMKELSSDLTVNTNIVTYQSSYLTLANGITEIPINIAPFNKDKDVLLVKVNHLSASEGVDYTISSDSSKITLTKPLQANQSVDFLVLQSVIVGDTETILIELGKLNTAITTLNADTGWINFTLENGALSFDDTTTPACRKFGNQVFVRGAVKNIDLTNAPICTLPTAMRPAINHQFATIAIANGQIAANCVIEVKTNGQVVIIAKSGTIPVGVMLPIATTFIVG